MSHTPSPTDGERRTATRHCWAGGAGGPPTVSVGTRLWKAPVHDLSPGGIGVVLEQELEPGCVVSVELPNPAWNCCHLKLLRVVHVTPQAGNRWLVGSTFLRRLTDDEFRAVVG